MNFFMITLKKKSENFLIIFPILYNTLPIIHERLIKSEGGCLHILNWDRANYRNYMLERLYLRD